MSCLTMGWAGHGLGGTWTVLAMVWIGNVLSRHELVWPIFRTTMRRACLAKILDYHGTDWVVHEHCLAGFGLCRP